jgi:hypothetical protein
MDFPIVPTALIIALVVGSLIQLIWNRDDWPLSNYSMYSYLVSDHVNNPFVPVSPERGEAGFLVLVLRLADGTSRPLTTVYAHPLLMPYERLRLLRHLMTLYKRGSDLTSTMQRLATWVHHRNTETSAAVPITSLALELYVWKRIPDRSEQHHAPDEIVELASVELPK